MNSQEEKMQKDFHYYCIAVLANAAGFNTSDALAIAYASQYVDDASISEPIPIESEQLKFDPVLTSYEKLKPIRSINWGGQKRVWVPFHFLPGEPFKPESGRGFSFETVPGSKFGQLLLEQADAESLRNKRRRLCKIGIALHTYADTWAHSPFSGRIYLGENDVEAIKEWDEDEQDWEKPLLDNILLDIFPKLGHAQAGFYPDIPYMRWKFQLRPDRTEIEKDNFAYFLKAAKDIYQKLTGMKKGYKTTTIPWGQIKPSIEDLLKRHGSLDDRCQNWVNQFGDVFKGSESLYDKDRWYDDAFDSDITQDRLEKKDIGGISPLSLKANFWHSFWVHFHRAALVQRHFVLERIP